MPDAIYHEGKIYYLFPHFLIHPQTHNKHKM